MPAARPPVEAPSTASTAGAVTLARVIGDRSLRSVYQPIVDLEDRGVVAYEALVRGPVGSDPATPGALFHAARREGRLAELDWMCRHAAVMGAWRAGLRDTHPLFVNVESSVLGTPPPAALAAEIFDAAQQLHLVVEFTERGILHNPAALLAVIGRVRERGWSIAVDDVGAAPSTLALLPVIDPDIIKLDLSLLASTQTGAQIAQICAVLAQAERREAIVLAEGIESEAQARRAQALGARLGQGWLFGRPGRLEPGARQSAWRSNRWRRRARPIAETPVRALFSRHSPAQGTKADLLGFSHHLEEWALQSAEPIILLSTFQTATRFGPDSRRRYGRLGRRCLLVAVGGEGMADSPAPGVRGWHIAPDDPLHKEWNVVLLGSHMAAAIAARDLGDDGRDDDRRFQYVLTFDRNLVIAAARSLLGRVPAAGPTT